MSRSFVPLARSVTLNVCVLPYVMRCTNTVVRIFGYQIVSLLRPVATTKYVLVVQTAAAHSIRNVYIAILNVYITIQYCWFYVVISNSTFQLRRIYTINGYNKKTHTHSNTYTSIYINGFLYRYIDERTEFMHYFERISTQKICVAFDSNRCLVFLFTFKMILMFELMSFYYLPFLSYKSSIEDRYL